MQQFLAKNAKVAKIGRMMKNPTISCIIATLNRPEALARTLLSLEKQSLLPHEVWVVSQGAAVPPQKPAGGFFHFLQQDVPNAQLARNTAARHATGDLLLFLDDDVAADPGLLETFAAKFQNPKIGAVCGAILEPGQEPTLDIPGIVRSRLAGWMCFPLNYGGEKPTRNFSSCNSCVRRELHLDAGGFDENFIVTIFDDSDWSIRLCQALERRGLEGLHLGSARLIHFRERQGGRRVGQPSTFIKVDAEGWASRLYFYRKNYGWSSWRELLRLGRRDLFCASLLCRPFHWVRACGEFIKGWRLASIRIQGGAQIIDSQKGGE